MKSNLRVYCEVARVQLYRIDDSGRGVWIWCKGHRREEFKAWQELGLTREVLESLLLEVRQQHDARSI